MLAKTGKPYYYTTLFISSLLLLIPALYNHYPLVNPDTATYLASGFKPETPFDRPIAYGLFIRICSLNGLSLWLVIFMQAYIVSWLIFRIINNILAPAYYLLYTIGTVLFLSLCTPLSWIVSQVQPDVFTSIGCLCVLLLLLNKETTRNRFLLYFLLFLAVGVHMSHPFLFCSILLCLLFFIKLIGGNSPAHFIKTIIIMAALSLSAIIFMGSAMSKSKHVFFTASLLEKGVLKTYLDENCVGNQYKICAYKDSLPSSFDDFIWSQSSPLYKIGSWAGTKKEFNTIIHNILVTPRYLGLFIKATIKQIGWQAITFNIGDGNTSFPSGSNVQHRIAEYLPREMPYFNNDRQNTTALMAGLFFPNALFIVIVILSLLVFFAAFYQWYKLSQGLKTLLIITTVAIICNIADCAAFSTTNGRYGCKMIWLIPFCAILFIAYYLLGKKNKNDLSHK